LSALDAGQQLIMVLKVSTEYSVRSDVRISNMIATAHSRPSTNTEDMGGMRIMPRHNKDDVKRRE
jgi:hypothetical protein